MRSVRARRRERGWTSSSTPDRTRQPAARTSAIAVIEASVDLIEEMARTAAGLGRRRGPALGRRPVARRARRDRRGACTVSRFGVIGSLRPSPRPPALDRLVERVRDGPRCPCPPRLARRGRLCTPWPARSPEPHRARSCVNGCGRRPATRCSSPNCSAPSTTTACCGSSPVSLDVAPGVTPANLHETLVRRLSWLPPETIELAPVGQPARQRLHAA